MIQIIAGKKGSGKTKRLIDMTNKVAREASNDTVFVDKDNDYMYEVDHNARFINACDYHVTNGDMFLGFLGGMLSSNHDIGTVFVDGFKKLLKMELADAGSFMEALADMAEKNNVTFVLSVSEDPALLPEFMAKYVI